VDVSVEVSADVSVDVSVDVVAGVGAGSSPIVEPKTIFKLPEVSATPSKVIFVLDPSAPGAK
jgi:hypothetical protein